MSKNKHNNHKKSNKIMPIGETKYVMGNDEQVSFLTKAFACVKEGKIPEAIKLCEELCTKVIFGDISLTAAKLWVSIDSNNYLAWNNYGLLCQNNGNSLLAIQVLEKALSINPDGVDAMSTISNAWHKEGNFKKAKEYNDILFNKFKINHPSVIEARARIMWDMGYKDEAYKLAKKLHRLVPNEASINHLLGRILLEIERDDEAEPYVLKCRDLNPDIPIYHYNAGLLYDAMGQMDKAEEELKTALAMFNKTDPDRTKFPKERETIAMITLEGCNEFKKYEMKSMDNIDTSLRYVDNIRSISPSHDMIEFNSVISPTNEWIFFFGDIAYVDMLMVNDERIIVGYRDAAKEIVINEDFPKYSYDEPCIMLGGATNYYHWICDYLPRMEIIDACPDLKDLPIIVQHELKSYHIESLKALGYDIERFVCAPQHHFLYFKKLYVPHIKHRPRRKNGSFDLFIPAMSKETLSYIRNRFAKYMTPREDLPKRIFVSRADAKFRRCENESEVFALAEQYGFKKVQNENLSFLDQVALFAGVEAVMGVHGAGFTNMVFAREGATLIELFPKETEAKFFQNICNYLNQHNYRVDGIRTNNLKMHSRTFWDFEVDIKDVKSALDKLEKPK